jgi:metal-responsive CopG/Arc/MetJ family transcriptional regulator
MPDPYIGVRIPQAMLERMEKVAPVEYWARSRFVRAAIAERLDRIERQHADRSLKQGHDADPR